MQIATAWAVRHPSGRIEPFSRDKLLLSLYKSCEHRKTALSDAGSLTDTVMHKLREPAGNGIVDSRQIAQAAQVALNRFDKAASVSYKAFHA
ncbi:MAG TPA: ATP cone domain-containing protein [Candidatus Saccharimonadales bacterium]